MPRPRFAKTRADVGRDLFSDDANFQSGTAADKTQFLEPLHPLSNSLLSIHLSRAGADFAPRSISVQQRRGTHPAPLESLCEFTKFNLVTRVLFRFRKNRAGVNTSICVLV